MKNYNSNHHSNRRDGPRRSDRLQESRRKLMNRDRDFMGHQRDRTINNFHGEDYDNYGSEYSGMHSSRSEDDDHFSSDYGPGSSSSRISSNWNSDRNIDREVDQDFDMNRMGDERRGAHRNIFNRASRDGSQRMLRRSESGPSEGTGFGLGSGRTSGIGGGSSRADYSGMGPKNYKRSDDRICEEVCDLLTESREIDASNIDIKVESGVVTLTGQLSDKWMKYEAEELAEGVRGVSEVRNNITVSREFGLSAGQSVSSAGKSSSSVSDRSTKKSA